MQVGKQSSDEKLAKWYQDELNALRRGKMAALARQTDYEVVMDQLESIRAALPELARDDFFIQEWLGRLGWSITLTADVTSFKCKELVDTLDFLLKAFPDSADYSTKDFPHLSIREYRFVQEGLQVEVNARLKGNGDENCQRVQVGVQTREEPIYEFRCA